MRIFLTQSGVDTFLLFKHLLPFNSSKRWFFDKQQLINQMNNWNTSLPWIKPFYALKSNNSSNILKTMTDKRFIHKIGLDAASMNEILLAKKYVKTTDIIYTNPHIIPHEGDKLCDLLKGIRFKIVDSVCELENIINFDITNDILLRVNSHVDTADCKFDSKFGVNIETAYKLVQMANNNNIKIRGLSFHIGSGGNHSRYDAYKKAFNKAAPLLNHLQQYSNEKIILDIGGGLKSDTDLTHVLGWTKDLPYEIIAEPGRYYSEPSYHLATQIMSITERGVFIDNGVYHELNVYHRDNWKFPLLTHYYDIKTNKIQKIDNHLNINIFGPTCDSYDMIKNCMFPTNINKGDWIFLNNMGAYSSSGKCDFNGIVGASNH